MKKTAKSILLVMLMAVLVFALTGCGNKNDKKKEEEKKDTIVGTREQNDDYFGNYTEEIEIEFKEDKADKITMSMIFDSEETAKGLAAIFALTSSETEGKMEIKQEGNKFMMIMDAAAYAEQEGIESEQLSKENLKKSLEDEGYTIK